MNEPTLEQLPQAAVELLTGDARQRLMRHLLRWDQHAALGRYLDYWLAAQPTSVTLREQRARLLLERGAGAEALAIIDTIDAERGATVGRRQLRLRALIAAGAIAAADTAVAPLLSDPAQQLYGWLMRGDIRRADGQPEAALAAYQTAQQLDPTSPAPVRRLAGLALAQGDGEGARGQIEALLLRPDLTPTVEDLRVLRDAARLLGDAAGAAALEAQLSERERQERAPLLAELGLRSAPAAVVPERSAEPAPPAERPLPTEAYALLRECFGLSEFRPNQSRVIASVLAGRNTLAVMPTGAGKSLTYQLPALMLPGVTIVVSPLIALMKDQIDGLPEALRQQATMITSALSPAEVAERMRGVAAGHYKLVYIAPERLRQRPLLQALKRCGVARFVVDEVHCISLWGQSFRPDYRFLGRAIAELDAPPLLALTATASQETQAEIQATLGATDLISASVFRPNLSLQVVRAGNAAEKQQALIALCGQIDGPVIVYARARQACEELADALRRAGVSASHYHAQVSDRAAVQERFMRGQVRVLVATIAFGMGIDKADIRGIIHYNLPQSLEAYAQEAGRAGRDGQPARCVLMYAATDKGRMTQWLGEQAITREQLRELYRALRRAVRGRYDLVNLDALQRAVPGTDETFARVGLSMLEQVGLVRRHFDLPRDAVVTLRGAAEDAELRRISELAGLTLDAAVAVDLLAVAEQAGLPPSELDGQLLAWHAAGLVRYQSSGREALLELLSAPADVGARIDTLLLTYRERQDQRVEAIAAYARAAQCRHRALAAHFGQRLAACRSACDICAPQQPALRVVGARSGGRGLRTSR